MASVEKQQLANSLEGKYFALISDGSTDNGFIEEEILYLRRC